MGARPLKRAIIQYVEDPLAEKILLHPDGEKKYEITIEDNKIKFIDKSKKKRLAASK